MDWKGFTCLNCRVAFNNADEQREHYRSDWHRYNLKRRSADLPAISLAEFQTKVRQLEQNDQASKQPATSLYCDPCKKSFSSPKTYEQHLVSKRHLQGQSQPTPDPQSTTVSKLTKLKNTFGKLQISESATDSEIMEIIEENMKNAPRFSPTDCLFCASDFSNLADLMDHMTSVHSFYIPDLDYLSDLEGLLKHLGEQISVYNCCIYCDERSKAYKSLEAVQKHMIDKGHCRIHLDPEQESDIFQFFDYSDCYETDDEECTDISTGISLKHPYIVEDESEMILPCGKVLGNRAYRIYYKQMLPENDVHESFVIKKLHEQYKTLGWSATPDAARFAAIQRQQATRSSKFALDIGLKHSGLQRHFRAQIL